MSELRVIEADASQSVDVVDVIHAAYGARPPLDPPSTAVHESVESIRAALGRDGGLLAMVDGQPAGTLLFGRSEGCLRLRRISVHPRFQHRGVATAMVGVAEEVADRRGAACVGAGARVELPGSRRFWERRGYVEVGREKQRVQFAKALPFEVVAASAEHTKELGRRIAAVLAAGDLVLLTGELGAGKTTLAQGLGTGLEVVGPVTSPTFIISRVHSPSDNGPALVHVDAYRLGGVAELDDLDLDASLDEAVTVVEWGEGVAEGLSSERLEISLTRTSSDENVRTIRVTPVGARWVSGALRAAVVAAPG
jgi:tRNA threonylcarbamoyladenosine biosynthesis protein TsaE